MRPTRLVYLRRKRPREQTDVRLVWADGDDPAAEHQYPFAVIEIESLRATSSFEKFAYAPKYLIWLRGAARADQTSAKDALPYICIYIFWCPNTSINTNTSFLPGSNFAPSGRVEIFRVGRSICSRRRIRSCSLRFLI